PGARRCSRRSRASGSTTYRPWSSARRWPWAPTSSSPASSGVRRGASSSCTTGERCCKDERIFSAPQSSRDEGQRDLATLHAGAGPRFSPRGPRRARASLAPQDARAPSGHDHRARRRVRHRRDVRVAARAPARSGLFRDRRHRAVRRGGARALPGRRGALPGRLALRARRADRVLRRGVVPAHARAPAGLRARGAAEVRARAQEARDRLLPAAAPATVEAQARRAVRAGLLHAHVRSRPLRRSSPERSHASALGSPDPSAPGDERSGFQVGRPREHRLRGHPVSVSLVIATFNHARFLGAALDSALAQTLKRVEVIVVDDGSTDETPAVLARYADRVRVVRQPNRGLAAARNTGLAAARGTYVSFLDADDVAMPTKLAVQVAVLEAAPTVGWTYCDVL